MLVCHNGRSPVPCLQALLFVGRAGLTVHSGEVSAFGCSFAAANGSTEVCADDRCGPPLLLEPGAAVDAAPPLAASATAVFTIARHADSNRDTSADGHAGTATRESQPSQANGCTDASSLSHSEQLGFSVWLAGTTAGAANALPRLPPLWHQAVAELEGSLAAQAAAGGGPPVILVCGAKKVGKSTFARFLVNGLLPQHPCVAYLDTGALAASLSPNQVP
jgi:polynucleotide 5'-hydroxyl-kinase GRC3/NOL9